ncbi:AraC family transcriptional regulator [Cupriavidus oxalaticus]|uniref:AraC family transcriptional regulator n=1 Tax=Cupriavidus oxalaticus TaxID=96344 RepID=A0A4P7L347_9BURK|nr:AraC family transcriptional regulator [Cupriavidus oxalaticus]QBY49868.1 AraC family transcriptional regulator [Cupriavidus oxalaticus]
MSYYLRSASLTNYVEVARAVGLDPHQQMRAAKISRDVLLDPDIRIPAALVGRLLDASARAAQVDDFGLRMAELRQFSNLGPLAFVVREQPTLRRALESMVRYMGLQNESLAMRLEESEGLVIIRLQVLSEESGVLRQATDLAVGVMFRMLSLFLGTSWRPRSICFTHPAPASVATCMRVFGIDPLFNQDFDGIVCAAADLEAPLPSYDPAMAGQVKRYLGSLLAQANATAPDKVRKLVYVLLPTGMCSVDRVAQHLGVDRRTIHRRLARDQTSYSEILNQVRAGLVVGYIENPDRPLSEVATLLGFTSLSTFSRWFSGEFGCSVSKWRSQQAQQAQHA